VLDYRPPNQESSQRGQQYKDSVIWESILELTRDRDLHLVSNDGDFCDPQNPTALHPILQQELDDRRLRIALYQKLDQVLRVLDPDSGDSAAEDSLLVWAPIERALRSAVEELIEEALRPDDSPLALGRQLSIGIQVFATETPGNYVVAFDADYGLVHRTSGSGDDAWDSQYQAGAPELGTEGEALFDRGAGKVTEVHIASAVLRHGPEIKLALWHPSAAEPRWPHIVRERVGHYEDYMRF
jgi:hypothetical protein